MPSRRELITGVAGVLTVTAGCLNDEERIARCGSRSVRSGTDDLRQISPIQDDEQIAMGILVSDRAVTEDRYHAVQIRDDAGELISSVPLMSNREMSSLDPEEYPVFGSSNRELYAVPLGPPPVHGEYTVNLISPDGEQIASVHDRINCYAEDAELP